MPWCTSECLKMKYPWTVFAEAVWFGGYVGLWMFSGLSGSNQERDWDCIADKDVFLKKNSFIFLFWRVLWKAAELLYDPLKHVMLCCEGEEEALSVLEMGKAARFTLPSLSPTVGLAKPMEHLRLSYTCCGFNWCRTWGTSIRLSQHL